MRPRKSENINADEIRAFFEANRRRVQNRRGGERIELVNGFIIARRYTHADAMRDRRRAEEQRIANLHPLERRYYTDMYNHHRDL